MKILPLALALLDGKVRDRVSDAKTTAKLFAVVGVFAALSATFFVIALTFVLAERFGTVEACLIMGALFGLIAAALYARHILQQRLRTAGKRAENAERIALASSAETALGGEAALILQAFLRGFMKK